MALTVIGKKMSAGQPDRSKNRMDLGGIGVMKLVLNSSPVIGV
jgi:hypothetical protein